MPKGEGQEGKKRGPYGLEKDNPLRKHTPSKALPPRVDVRSLVKTEEDPDLIESRYQKKLKSEKSEKGEDFNNKEEDFSEEFKNNLLLRSKIVNRFLNRKS